MCIAYVACTLNRPTFTVYAIYRKIHVKKNRRRRSCDTATIQQKVYTESLVNLSPLTIFVKCRV